MENGGIYAVQILEAGEIWQKMARCRNTNAKEKCFEEDFIAAGEYLQKNDLYFARIYGTFWPFKRWFISWATMTMRPDLGK